MQFIILLLHVLTCVSIIALVLVQHGKGADIGAAFGAGASQTVFGSSGSGSFLMKLTGGLAAIFFMTSLSLGFLVSKQQKQTQYRLPTTNSKSIVIPGESSKPTTTIKTQASEKNKSQTKQ